MAKSLNPCNAACFTAPWGGQSWPQPPFRRPQPAKSRLRAELPALRCNLLALLLALTACHKPTTPHLTLHPNQILADGYETATLQIDPPTPGAIVTIANPRIATLAQTAPAEASIQAGVNPGRTQIRVAIPNTPVAEIVLQTLPFYRDSAEDGTPDFMRLQDDRDQQQFRRYFTRLAEAQYFEPPASRAPEINDCAALIRYAYREALRTPTAIAKYRYPFTPLGAALFRVRPGAFQPSDLTDGSFAQFADAKTLCRLNAHLEGRMLSAAMPGDLLFFHQEAGAERFHSMIYLGESQLQNDGSRYILYHTGPGGSGAGEMRRLTVAELMNFPRTEWRPLANNPRFLGVFRWNILRKEIDTPFK